MKKNSNNLATVEDHLKSQQLMLHYFTFKQRQPVLTLSVVSLAHIF